LLHLANKWLFNSAQPRDKMVAFHPLIHWEMGNGRAFTSICSSIQTFAVRAIDNQVESGIMPRFQETMRC